MKKYVESEKIELKRKYTDTICKEIESFLNTDGGIVFIGIDDNGQIIGVDNVDETIKKISEIITSQIEPSPIELVKTEIIYELEKSIIKISVLKGIKSIYCQKKYGFSPSGCHLRIGTTCKEMTTEQIKLRYEQSLINNDLMIITPAKYGNISFKTLKVYYTEKGYHIDDISFCVNFNLIMHTGEYNQLGELMSDNNNIPFIVVKFNGNDKASISEKSDYGKQCLLFVYERIKNRIIAENVIMSDTTKRPRRDKFLYDFDSVNEAVINALVHNDYNISQPLISFFNNRIEILSHGGLPKGQTKVQFFNGISRPRNDMLARIFQDMDLVEHTGHGIPTIVKKYGKNVFDITDTYINVVIPYDKEVMKFSKSNVVMNVGMNVGLSNIEKKTIKELLDNPKNTAKSISKKIGVSTRTIERAFNSLQEKSMILRSGSKRDGKWVVIK